MPLPAAFAVISGVAAVGGIIANSANTAIKAASQALDSGPSAASLAPLVDTMATDAPWAGFRHELAKNVGLRVKIRGIHSSADDVLERIGDITGEFEKNDLRTSLTRELVDQKLAGLK